jgi:outer membrane protein TolC
MQLRIDRGSAKRIGVSSASIGNTVRTAVSGAKASALRDGEEEYDIVVRLAPEYREDLQSVLALRLPGREDTSPDTFPVPLSTVASYALDGGTGAIKHVDQDLVITISGDVDEGVNQVEVQQAVAELIAKHPTPPGYFVELSGSTDEQEEASAFLLRAFLIACALIMLVLVTQFDSFWIPVIIMVTVVLSLIGVLWGLVLTGTPFGIIMTGIGVVSLAGVVVNNAIVLLDYVEQLRARGMSTPDALVRAGLTRFRPVMLTAVTTVLGLIPMAVGASIDFINFKIVLGSTSAQWWGPMAVALIFGLSVATVLTLVMVPTLYGIYDDLQRLTARVRGLFTRRSAAVAVGGTALVLVGLLLSSSARAVTLDEAYAAAEANSVTVALLSEQTFQTALQREKAWSALSPRVSVNGSWILNEFEIAFDPAGFAPDIPGLEIDSDPVVIQEKSFLNADLTVSQRLFSGSALPALRSTFKATQAARLSEARERGRIRVGVAQAYYGALMARAGETLAASALETARSQQQLADRQVEAGLAAPRAVLQAKLAVSQGERDLLLATERRVTAEEAWHRATGLPRDAELVLPDPAGAPGSLDAALVEVVGRADLEAAELQTQSARLAHTARAMTWAPVVDAQFKYNYSQNTGFQDDPTNWQFLISAGWTLWDGGLRVAETREYASQVRMAELRSRQLQEGAEEEVRVAWEGLQRASRSMTAVDDELSLARENVRLAEGSFQAGNATWLEVQQAQLTLQSAELNAIQQRMNRDLAALQLGLATGSTTR